MNPIPVLVVFSPVKGILLVNGRLACEVDGSASFPVSPMGDVFLTFMAYGSHLPLCVKLRYQNGSLLAQDSRVKTVAWPDGVCEVFLRPYPTPGAVRVIDTLETPRAHYRLLLGDGVQLVGSDPETDETLLDLHEADATSASFRLLDDGAPAVLFLLGGQQRLLVLHEGERVRPVLDVRGTKITLRPDGAGARVQIDLLDEAGHTLQETYAKKGENYALHQREYIRGIQTHTMTGEKSARALAQALALGLEEEALSYLSPALARGGLEKLRTFFGLYTAVEEPRFGPMEKAGAFALLCERAEGSHVASVFVCEREEAGITRIARWLGPDRLEEYEP